MPVVDSRLMVKQSSNCHLYIMLWAFWVSKLTGCNYGDVRNEEIHRIFIFECVFKSNKLLGITSFKYLQLWKLLFFVLTIYRTFLLIVSEQLNWIRGLLQTNIIFNFFSRINRVFIKNLTCNLSLFFKLLVFKYNRIIHYRLTMPFFVTC